jgi:uncharacterized protein (DUF2147 family)
MNLRATIATAAALFMCAISVPAHSSNHPVTGDESEPLAVKYPPEAILGEWWTEKEDKRPSAKIKFVLAQDGTYTGILAWSPESKKDVHNKDPKLRDRPVVGIVLMWNLRYDDGEYTGGYVYNPEDGGTYRFKAEVLTPEWLKIRGYLGIALFGQTQKWSRTQQGV